jgi:hypothetical protein
MDRFDRDIQLRALLKVASDLESAMSLCPCIEFEDVQRLHELMSQVQEILQRIRDET